MVSIVEGSAQVVVRRSTVSIQAYHFMKDAIIHGKYAAGSKLVVRPIAEEMGLSATPVKAALVALEHEGLLELRPHRGYFVRQLDEKAISDICTFRGALDRLAAELVARQSDRSELIRQLEESLAEQALAIEQGGINDYADLNNSFHEAIWAASGNEKLIRAATDVADQVRLLVNTSAGVSGRPTQSLHEHAEIIAALRQGDAELAGQRAVRHALNSEKTLLSCLAPVPAPPV